MKIATGVQNNNIFFEIAATAPSVGKATFHYKHEGF
jgi:hypothetical protein